MRQGASPEALHGELWVVAVSAGAYRTSVATRGGNVFGWGESEGLGLPGNADGGSEDLVLIFSPCGYAQLAGRRRAAVHPTGAVC